MVSLDLFHTATRLGGIVTESGFCDTSKHSPKHEFVKWIQGIPIHITHQPARVVDGRLPDFCSGVRAIHFEL